jgi:hypothetical protein
VFSLFGRTIAWILQSYSRKLLVAFDHPLSSPHTIFPRIKVPALAFADQVKQGDNEWGKNGFYVS